jgi:methionyl-tRNA formyltransferase
MEKKDLRIVFMGTPEFAVASLKAILDNGYQIAGVITAPDKPAGRGRKIQFSPIKQFALENNLHLLQPGNLKDPEFIEQLQQLKPDIQVVVAFRMLPESVWNLPPKGTFNLHASLLPQYRGAAPINHAIINGEEKTGVTTFLLDKEIDTGKILARRTIAIAKDDIAGTLHDKLMIMGANLVIDTLEMIRLDNIEPVDQQLLVSENENLKKAPKIFKEHCRIDWNQDAEVIHNMIRGLCPIPGAYTEIQPTERSSFQIKIFEATPIQEKHTHNSGELFTDNKNFIKITAKNGFIAIKSLQASGKKRMKTDEFLRGYTFSDAKII